MTLQRDNFLGSGLSVKQVAKRANRAERTITQLARHGDATPYTAQRLAHICQCPIEIFLWGLAEYQKRAAGTSRDSSTRNSGNRDSREANLSASGLSAQSRRTKHSKRGTPILRIVE